MFGWDGGRRESYVCLSGMMMCVSVPRMMCLCVCVCVRACVELCMDIYWDGVYVYVCVCVCLCV